MKRVLAVAFIFALGAGVGLYLGDDRTPVLAGVETCTSVNGDVNASGVVDLSDAVTILTYLFLGNPPQLPPACRPAAEVPRDSILGVLLVVLDIVSGLDEVIVPASCGGSPTVCCPGGNPHPECGPLKFELVETPSVLASPDPRRFPFTLRMRAQSLSDIPVNFPGVGDCGVQIDTTAGFPHIELRSEMVFREATPEDPRPVVFSSFVLDHFEEEDISITGGFGCALADSGFVVGTIRDLLTDLVADRFSNESVSGLCQPLAGCQRP